MRVRHKDWVLPTVRPALAPTLMLAVVALASGACSGDGVEPDRQTPVPAEAGSQTGGAAGQAPAAEPARDAPPASEILDLELERGVPMAMAPYLTSPDAAIRRQAVRALGRTMRASAAQEIASVLRDPDPSVREAACFAIGLTGAPEAAALLGPAVGPEAKSSAAEIAAAIQGLANCSDESASDLLVRLATRDELPVEGPEALFRHARARKAPWTTGIPSTRLLRFETHASPRGRAGIGWIGRVWKDPALLDPMDRLAGDRDPEVRRAIAMGLGEGKKGFERSANDVVRALAILQRLMTDADPRVVVAAVRASSSYDVPAVVDRLRSVLTHPSFHVRTAACEGLGARKGVDALPELERLAKADPSTSVRYAAASAVVALDAPRAQGLVEVLLKHPAAFVRSAGCAILGKATDAPSTARLIALAKDDPHVLVRQAAVQAFSGKATPEAMAAVREALGSKDVGIAGTAASVIGESGWKHLVPDLVATFPKHVGTPGADAREAIITALATLQAPEGIPIIQEAAAADPDAGPRAAAIQAIADASKQQVGPPDRRPRAEGAKGPLGAPYLARDVDLVVETDQGTMRIRLDAVGAPLHAAHVADLARKGFYDGLNWHRVVPDFVIQGGCPRGDGSGNAGVSLPIEPTLTPFERGTLGMPRSGHPDSGGCQLFICHSRAPHLDVTYTAFGRVIEGMDVIDRIDVDSKIVRVTVAEAK